jgi:Pregnancy-associated plasma protein-A
MVEEQAVPSRRGCGAAAAYYLAVEAHPEYRERQRELEGTTAQRMALGTAALAPEGPITIPVVVHVVYNEDSENISDAQIESQISVLNQDFAAQNPNQANVPAIWEGFVADTNIQFALASEDPVGDATPGITRTETDSTAFGVDDSVKSAATGGVDPWPTDRYLNMWVCTLAGGLLGYAQFPGGLPETDGVVIRNTAFGTTGTAAAPFNGGQTATHEVGHFLNLYHIWGLYDDCTGGDRVADTPNAAGPNYGEPNFPHVSCNNGPNGDMFMNYMDYVDDRAMFMFTPQQVARMMATLEGPRSALGRS